MKEGENMYSIIKDLFYELEQGEMNQEEVLELIQDLIKDMSSDPIRFCDELNNEFKEYSLQKGYCPDCLVELVSTSWKESRSEYFGSPANETITNYVCPSCNAEYDWCGEL
jgi:uncharacterized protein with PIN domain